MLLYVCVLFIQTYFVFDLPTHLPTTYCLLPWGTGGLRGRGERSEQTRVLPWGTGGLRCLLMLVLVLGVYVVAVEKNHNGFSERCNSVTTQNHNGFSVRCTSVMTQNHNGFSVRCTSVTVYFSWTGIFRGNNKN